VTQPSPTVKNLSSREGDRLIRALIAEGKGFYPTTFSETEVERVMGIGEDRSFLVLRSGVKIPVALSYEQLEQKIYQPDFKNDGTVLDLRAVTGEAAKPKAPANTNQAPAPGDKMPDGTVFAGVSPDTGIAMFTMAKDASYVMTFNDSAEYTLAINKEKYCGHQDWRVPTKAELNVLFNNRAAIGGFVISGSHPAGWYWSASSNLKWLAWGQRFSDGYQNYYLKGNPSSVRCVR
jgi:hypothetical protein